MPLPTHLFWEAPRKASRFIWLAPQGRYHAFGVFIKTNFKRAQTTPLYHGLGFRQPKWLPRVFSKCFHLQQPPFSLNQICSNILCWLVMLLLSPKAHAMSCMFKRLEAIFSMFLASSRERRCPWFCLVSRWKLKFISKGAIHIKGSYVILQLSGILYVDFFFWREANESDPSKSTSEK